MSVMEKFIQAVPLVNPWINNCVDDIDNKVRQHDTHRDNHHDGLNQWKISVVNGLHRQPADTRIGEYLFGNDGAPQQSGDLKT